VKGSRVLFCRKTKAIEGIHLIALYPKTFFVLSRFGDMQNPAKRVQGVSPSFVL